MVSDIDVLSLGRILESFFNFPFIMTEQTYPENSILIELAL